MFYSVSVLCIRVIAIMIPWHVDLLYFVMPPSLRTLLIFSFIQDIHFLSPPDTSSVESSRVSIDLIPLAPTVSILPNDHSGIVHTAIILAADFKPRESTSYYVAVVAIHSFMTATIVVAASSPLRAPPQATYLSHSWLYWSS